MVGKITNEKNAMGNRKIIIPHARKEISFWCENDIHTDLEYAIFEFDPNDQFCHFVRKEI